MSSNVKKVFVKLNWLKSYWAVNFVFSAILLLFLEIWWSLECHIFLTKWGFQKLFSHSSSSLSTLSKLLTCYGISWNLYFAVNLMKSFSCQKPLKSKIKKHTYVGKTKFYYRAKSQLKRLKIKKLVWKRSLFYDSWLGVIVRCGPSWQPNCYAKLYYSIVLRVFWHLRHLNFLISFFLVGYFTVKPGQAYPPRIN